MICPPGFHVEEICVADPPVGPTWVDLGAVSAIAANPSPMGRQIVALQPFKGRLYLGYGDWDSGKQAGCDLIAWDGIAFVTIGHYPTDAFWTLKIVAGQLWAIVTDPEIGGDPDAVIVSPDGTVTTLAGGLTPYPWHTFDVALFEGHIYIAGAYRTQQANDGVANQSWAQVWRADKRADGAAIWPASLQVKTNYRAYGLGVIGETMYVALANGAGRKTNDGVTWVPSPAPPAHGVTRFGDNLLGFLGWPAYGPQMLVAFDGNPWRVVTSGVNAFCVDGEAVFVLTGGTIKQTNNLTDWTTVCTDAPANGRSLAVMDGALYVGTADSHVWMRI